MHDDRADDRACPAGAVRHADAAPACSSRRSSAKNGDTSSNISHVHVASCHGLRPAGSPAASARSGSRARPPRRRARPTRSDADPRAPSATRRERRRRSAAGRSAAGIAGPDEIGQIGQRIDLRLRFAQLQLQIAPLVDHLRRVARLDQLAARAAGGVDAATGRTRATAARARRRSATSRAACDACDERARYRRSRHAAAIATPQSATAGITRRPLPGRRAAADDARQRRRRPQHRNPARGSSGGRRDHPARHAPAGRSARPARPARRAAPPARSPPASRAGSNGCSEKCRMSTDDCDSRVRRNDSYPTRAPPTAAPAASCAATKPMTRPTAPVPARARACRRP